MPTLGQIFEGLNPHFVGCDASTVVTQVRDDSRRVSRGDLFVATRGGTHDAHRFVPQVIQAGAAVVVVQAGKDAGLSHPHVVLPDPTAALPMIAANAMGRPADALALAGVTGTNGKTTTTYLVSAMFEAAGHRYLRIGTTGNEVAGEDVAASFTTPFPLELQALLRTAVDRDVTHGVMEVSSHALAQHRVEPLRFRSVGLTSFSQDHLDFHPSMEAYLEAKCELVRHYVSPDAIAVAAVDEHPAARGFLECSALPRERVWRASKKPGVDAEIRAEDARFDATGTRARIHTPAGSFTLETRLLGDYNLDNIMVATGLALGLGLELDAIATGLSRTSGAPGRLEPVVVPGVEGPKVVVDYAHTPDAVARALEVVRPLTRGRLFVVLGCGGDRDPSKRPLMGAAAASHADRFYATSDNPRSEAPEQIVEHMLGSLDSALASRVVREVDRAQAIARAVAEAAAEDLVVIAGKGHETVQIIGSTKVPFDDRDHARRALRARG